MRRTIPSQLILFAVLVALGVTGWIYIYSCRDKVVIDLQTITGDPSCLLDKELDIQFITNNYFSSVNSRKLEIGFSSGLTIEKITYENATAPSRCWGDILLIPPNTHNKDYGFLIGIYEDKYTPVELPGLHIIDETARLLDESDYSEYTASQECGISFTNPYITLIEMDGIVYITIPDYFSEPLFNYYLKNEWIFDEDGTETYYYELANPVEFSAQSGIWAVDDSSGASPENVVPFSITSNPDDPKVVGIYKVETENAIVLLTIENKTDLYATVYDTKTKTSRDPVLIFQSDSGVIHPTISRENNTCPMGSILVEVNNDEKECYALALAKNEMNGNVEPLCYDVTQIISSSETFKFYEHTDNYGYPISRSEIFYHGEEIWIIQNIGYKSYVPSTFPLALDSPNYPFSSQLAQQFSITVYKNGDIFYDGLLSIDLTIADKKEQLNMQLFVLDRL